MELCGINFTPAQFKFVTTKAINLLHSRLKSIQIDAEYVGVLHIRDENFSAIMQFQAILQPKTKFTLDYQEPQYILKQIDEEIILEGDNFKTVPVGTVIGINGTMLNDKLSGEIIFANNITNVEELSVQNENNKGVFLVSDIKSSIKRLSLVKEYLKFNNQVSQTVIGGNLFQDPLADDTQIKNFEFSPTDTYIQLQTEFKYVDAILNSIQNCTVLSGFTDPISLEFPVQQLPSLVFPLSKVKTSGNPSIAESDGLKIIFIHYGRQVDLEMIFRSGHLFPEVGLHFPMKDMQEDCMIVNYDVLVAFGQEKTTLKKVFSDNKVVYLLGVSILESVIIDFENLDSGINIIDI